MQIKYKNRIEFFIIIFFVFVLPSQVFACMCARESYNNNFQFDNANIIFSGKVLDIKDTVSVDGWFYDNMGFDVIFNVEKIYKGVIHKDINKDTILVRTDDSSVGCGFNFEKNKKYIVYVDKNGSTSACSGTEKYSHVKAIKTNILFNNIIKMKFTFIIIIISFICYKFYSRHKKYLNFK